MLSVRPEERRFEKEVGQKNDDEENEKDETEKTGGGANGKSVFDIVFVKKHQHDGWVRASDAKSVFCRVSRLHDHVFVDCACAKAFEECVVQQIYTNAHAERVARIWELLGATWTLLLKLFPHRVLPIHADHPKYQFTSCDPSLLRKVA